MEVWITLPRRHWVKSSTTFMNASKFWQISPPPSASASHTGLLFLLYGFEISCSFGEGIGGGRLSRKGNELKLAHWLVRLFMEALEDLTHCEWARADNSKISSLMRSWNLAIFPPLTGWDLQFIFESISGWAWDEWHTNFTGFFCSHPSFTLDALSMCCISSWNLLLRLQGCSVHFSLHWSKITFYL